MTHHPKVITSKLLFVALLDNSPWQEHPGILSFYDYNGLLNITLTVKCYTNVSF